jgi:hypothetical protein
MSLPYLFTAPATYFDELIESSARSGGKGQRLKRLQTEHSTFNIQHPTSNGDATRSLWLRIEAGCDSPKASGFSFDDSRGLVQREGPKADTANAKG